MKAPIATIGSDLPARWSPPRIAQDGRRAAPRGRPAGAARRRPPAPAPGRRDGAKADPKVFPAETVLPAPTPPDQIKPATIALPTDPIEPYLLTKEAGPFMVMAKTFRGPDAERYALALALELRQRLRPARLHPPDQGLPDAEQHPQRPAHGPRRTSTSRTSPSPRRSGRYDEAAVLVGNEKTLTTRRRCCTRSRRSSRSASTTCPSIFWLAARA